MKTVKEIIAKRKKFRKRLKKAIFDYGTACNTGNCRYWVDSLPGEKRCSFISGDAEDLRACPGAESCIDFECKYTEADLIAKYDSLVTDNLYLAKNYRDLFVLNWVLEDEEDEEQVEEVEIKLPMYPDHTLISKPNWITVSYHSPTLLERFKKWITNLIQKITEQQMED